MGGAFTGLADDSSALYFNPAGLATLKNREFGLHHQRWLADTYQEDFSLALPFPGLGTLGLALGYLDLGDFQGFDASGLATPSYRASRITAQADWSRPLAWGLSAGFGIK